MIRKYQRIVGLFFLLIFMVFPACTNSGIVSSGEFNSSQLSTEEPNAANAVEGQKTRNKKNPTADTILTNGLILTMNEEKPVAEAIAISGDRIIFVGSSADVKQYEAEETKVTDLKGLTVTPGFIDSHAHWINSWDWKFSSPEESVHFAISQGWTSINELYADQFWLDELTTLDNNGSLPIRVNAYLPYNFMDEKFGHWYENYQPFTNISPHVRIAGLKIFMDHAWGQNIHWTRDELNAFIDKTQREGWPVAAHTVGLEAHDMLLDAFALANEKYPNQSIRNRIEHTVMITDENLQRLDDLGLVASIQLNGPNEWVEDPAFKEIIPSDEFNTVGRWRDLIETGVLTAGSDDWPYGDLEGQDPPFGSVMRLLHQAVARVGNDNRPPEDWMVDQSITIEKALRLLTINGAYATMEEDDKGSLSPGKLADMVVLSKNPVAIPLNEVTDIQVLMTMIGGKVEYCQDTSICSESEEMLKPAESDAQAVITASASTIAEPPKMAFDEDPDTAWISGGDAEQWIQYDLEEPTGLKKIHLVVSQYPEGDTTHEIWAGNTAEDLTLIHTFSGYTEDFLILEKEFDPALDNIRFVRILTTSSPSWVAWREITIN